MRIEEIIFTDGQIISYQQQNDSLVIEFLDYTNQKVKIVFQGSIQFEDNKGVRVEFADYYLSKNNNQRELSLLDDEENIIFKVVFDEASYQIEND
ncbi:MAG TPA: hypothetical protein PKY82_16280 [Pyrinomonadaceae bacterium]|nr:hypothetical protein [Pyrinomonadaceae bacterium]